MGNKDRYCTRDGLYEVFSFLKKVDLAECEECGEVFSCKVKGQGTRDK